MKRIFYQKLTIPINELENKRQFKCFWCADPPNGEEKELVLYPNRFLVSSVLQGIIIFSYRNATVSELFVEAKSSGQLDLAETGTGKLRLVEIISNKIFCISRPEQTLESLQVTWFVCHV